MNLIISAKLDWDFRHLIEKMTPQERQAIRDNVLALRELDEPEDILYSNGSYFVVGESFGTGRFKPKSEGYSVYRNGITHSTRCAVIGWTGEVGLRKAIAEADRRASEE